MGYRLLITLLCWLLGSIGLQAKTTYKAAVVTLPAKEIGEPLTESRLRDLLIEDNIKIYENYIKEAGKQKVDILVFPEATLNYNGMPNKTVAEKFALVLPSVAERITPCDESKYNKILARICKAVKSAKVYTVVNVVEQVDCKIFKNTCGGKDNINLFNTNIVFDRNGMIIYRYRKINLFGEEMMDTPKQTEMQTFTTDFGETFLTVICFDLIFKTPTMDVINSRGIHNVILSTMWYSKTPFLTAPQVQMGFAVANNLNLLAACGISVKEGAGGSGIYSGRTGSLQMDLTDTGESKMLVADVPSLGRREKNQIITYGSLDGTNSRMSQIEFNNVLPELKITQHAFPRMTLVDFTPIKKQYTKCPLDDRKTKQCCKYELEFTTNQKPQGQFGYHYYFASYWGVRKFGGNRMLGELFCAVVACTGTNPTNQCGQRYPAGIKKLYPTVNFQSITITMTTQAKNNAKQLENVLVMPSTLSMNMLPLQSNQYQYTSGISQKIKTSVIKTRNNNLLYTFGFYGRNFNDDMR